MSEHTEDATTEVPLMEAAVASKRSYSQALRLGCTGALSMRRIGGRWFVTRESLERLLAADAANVTARKP
ncbi:MAG TPA: hypothetical protein VFS33_08145 [Gemmatimonadales bacterium]|nr:hypothetical protein [Gemmatimonadales bacterium]